MCKTTFLLSILFFACSSSSSQNLTGTWEDKSGDYCKLVIVQINDSLFGYTYDTGMGYCKADFVGRFDSIAKNVKGKNTRFIERTFLHGRSVYHLTYSRQGDNEYLRGTARPKSTGAKIASFGMGLPVKYVKTKQTIDTSSFIETTIRHRDSIMLAHAIEKEPLPVSDSGITVYKTSATNDSLLLLQKNNDSITAVKESRRSVIQQAIITKADSVKIILYDDGDIDGDIVTIFDNGKIIVNKLLLTKAPYHITLALPQNGSKHTIELMAENEGNIPPNTAYMLVVAGNERVEVKTSSDKLSNAAIVIQKEE